MASRAVFCNAMYLVSTIIQSHIRNPWCFTTLCSGVKISGSCMPSPQAYMCRETIALRGNTQWLGAVHTRFCPPYLMRMIEFSLCIYLHFFGLKYTCIYIYIYVLKTLRATAVSTGDGAIFEQGGNQGNDRNHQDPTGHASFTHLGGSQSAPWALLGGPQGPLKYRGGSQRPLTPGPIEIF